MHDADVRLSEAEAPLDAYSRPVADDLVRRLGHDAIGRPLEARAIRGGRIERRTVVTRERR